MVYTVLDNEIFHTADDVELISYYESQVSRAKPRRPWRSRRGLPDAGLELISIERVVCIVISGRHILTVNSNLADTSRSELDIRVRIDNPKQRFLVVAVVAY